MGVEWALLLATRTLHLIWCIDLNESIMSYKALLDNFYKGMHSTQTFQCTIDFKFHWEFCGSGNLLHLVNMRRSRSWMICARPFCSSSIHPPIPGIWLFQNLILEIQGQGLVKDRGHEVGRGCIRFTLFCFTSIKSPIPKMQLLHDLT